MANKSFGWIQDAGKLSSLKPILREFIKYEFMSSSETHGIISESLGIGRWADETYLRFAEALGFIEYDREYDEFIISEIGKKLANSNETEEHNLLSLTLLSYPPACRVLELLRNSDAPLSKFEIAQKLGFTDEAGFPTFGLNNFIIAYHMAIDKNKIKSNKESTLDKYARMIAGYLVQMGWATKASKKLIYEDYEAETPHTFQITTSGIQAYTRSVGTSTSQKIIKNISYEMLASKKQAGSMLLRKRRALILELMNKRKGKLLEYSDVQTYLHKNDSDITPSDLNDDISKLQNVGLRIEQIGSTFVLSEKINLNIPIFTTQNKKIKKEIQSIVDELKAKTTQIDDGFIDKIVTEAFSGRDKCKEFEDSVFELYNNLIGFNGIKLGGIGNREPDSLFWYKVEDNSDGYGLIVDAKAYSKGFKINTTSARQMNDYIYQFTNKLQLDHNVNRSHYHWVTSKYSGNGDIEDFANNVRSMYSFESKGSIISIANSIIIADSMKKERNFNNLEKILTIEREILESDIRIS